MKYATLMFDVVESRKYQEKYIVQNILMQCVNYLNRIYRSSIKKDVVPSAGDEFQGLFMDIRSAFLYVRKLQLLVYPIKIRSGIGYGNIEYDINEWSSPAFNGDAYYLARDAINAIPKRRGNIICFNTESPYDKYINMYCLANADIKSRQSQIARWIEMLADILSPIQYVCEDIEIYDIILKNRAELIEQEQWDKPVNRTRALQIFDTDFELLFQLKNPYVETDSYLHSLYIESFWEYGMATKIALTMNTSRQNIDRYVLLGRIKESRTMDKTIFKLLGEAV